MIDAERTMGGATDAETAAMGSALRLARCGPVHDPNPRVGCVILSPAGRTLAEGFHRGAGTPHAEVTALQDAARRGVDVRGATAVVTLEPCAHTGRTGPCARALADAGIARVVYSVADPSALAGGGADLLRSAGVGVFGGLLEKQGRDLLGHWWDAARMERPWVTLKLAVTLDGRVAAADGTSRWITGPQARAHAHRMRAQSDAVVVGTGTVLADDPSLTARVPGGGAHQPLRVVVGHRVIPPAAALHGPGGKLVHLRTHDPHEVLAALFARGVHQVVVEGGPTLAAAFVRADLVDQFHVYVAPVLLGAGAPAIGDLGIDTMADARRLRTTRIQSLGADLLLVTQPTTRAEPPTSATASTTKES